MEEDPLIKITMTFRVTDPDALLVFAKDAYFAAWSARFSPASLAEAVYEAVGPSSRNPGFDLLGLELVEQPEPAYEQLDGPIVSMAGWQHHEEESDGRE